MTDALAGWGIAPKRTERPESPPALCDLIRSARAAGETILPVGGGHALSAGGRPLAGDVVLDCGGLSRILRVVPGDLTVTVQGGAPLPTLTAALAEHGLQLPGARSERGTIGGLLASGFTTREAGLLHGALSERVLGLTVVDGEGVLSRSGGQVVKNVTGYDLHRLHAGPGGAFGVLVEVTLRLEPLPEERLCLRGVLPSLEAAATAWRRLRLEGPEPAAVVVEPAPGDGASVHFEVHLAGDREVVASESAWLRRELELEPLRDARGDWADAGLVDEGSEGWQAVVRTAAAQWPGTIRALGALSEKAWLRWQALPELGAVRVAAPPEFAKRTWIETLAGAAGGRWQYRVEREPAGSEANLPAWSARPSTYRLLRRLKEAWDPGQVLRPGSYSAASLEYAAEHFERIGVGAMATP